MTAETIERAKGEDRRTIWSWCLYDFANSPFTTLVVTFVYGTFFTKAFAARHYFEKLQTEFLERQGEALSIAQQTELLAEHHEALTRQAEALATALWAHGVTATALFVALLSPFLGALADRGGFRKLFLILATAVCIVASLALYGISEQIFLALLVFVVANIAFEMGMVFYNAFLPDVAPVEKVGRISGFGWGLGYVGGLIALVVALVTLVKPEVPWFGFSTENGENIRATNLLVAAWFALFSVPTFLWVREDRSRATTSKSILRESYLQLVDTFREIRKYRQIVRFLLARLIYNDGLVTIFAFGGIYAAGTFGFTFEEVLVFGIVLNVTAGLGASIMGFFDDKLGGRRTLEISLWALTLAAVLAVLAPGRVLFWVAGILMGVFSGPNQAASRSLMARFVPPDKENEFFGFFAFSGKATALLGPFLFGLMTKIFSSQQSFHPQRAGVSVVIVFFVLGLLLLRRVDEAEGIAATERS